jgi:hypothetical protein
MKMNPKTETINQRLCTLVQNGELSNTDIISIIDNLASYLNLMSISDYAKLNYISYNGVKKRIESGSIVKYTLFNQKFIIDNE